ncbi:hypothetical protein AAMO2058_000571700 [Amorphochlora amoebiformis]
MATTHSFALLLSLVMNVLLAAMLLSQSVPANPVAVPVRTIARTTLPVRSLSAARCPKGLSRPVVAQFKFLKDLGIKKPDFLPDFGGPKKARMAEEFVTSGFPSAERAPTFTVTVNGEAVDGEELENAIASAKTAADFNAQPYDEETLERTITFTLNGKDCNLRMTQEGKVLSANL